MSGRASAIPRSVYPLLGLLVLAGLWLWRGDGDLAGPRVIFDFPAESIEACTVRGPGGRTMLTREPGGWRLGGDKPDIADVDGIAHLMEGLTATLRTGAVAGDDWRTTSEDYGLDGGGIFEVRLTVGGSVSRLRIGAQNPASGLFYATGTGSDDLFMVGEDVVGALHALPNTVRATMLWPGFKRDDPDTVRLHFDGADTWDLAVRDGGGRWWLRATDDSRARTGRISDDYHARYADRRKTEAGVEWLRMRDREMAGLLSYLEDARVRDFLAPEFDAPDLGFAVRIAGSVAHEVVFGELETENRARAWRDGYVDGLVLPGVIPRECAGGLSEYLHTDLLDRGLAFADSFTLSRADMGLVRFVNTDRGWIISEPAQPADPDRMKLMAGDLVHFLDHVAIERVFDPAADDPLTPPRTTIQIWATGPGVPPRTVIRCGMHADTGVPVAWYSDDGRLVQVDRNLLITSQTILMAAVGQRR